MAWTPDAGPRYEVHCCKCQWQANLPQCGTPNFPTRLRSFIDGPDGSALGLHLQAAGVAADVHRHAAVQQTVDDRVGDDAIDKELAPGTETPVAGQDHRPALVAATGQLEKQVGALAIEGQLADFVDDLQP